MKNKILSPFEAIDQAYKRGIRAGKKGASLSDNPYPELEEGTLNSRLTCSWDRGWCAGRLGKSFNTNKEQK